MVNRGADECSGESLPCDYTRSGKLASVLASEEKAGWAPVPGVGGRCCHKVAAGTGGDAGAPEKVTRVKTGPPQPCVPVVSTLAGPQVPGHHAGRGTSAAWGKREVSGS